MYFCKSNDLNLSRYYPLAISLPSFLISRVLLGLFLHGWVHCFSCLIYRNKDPARYRLSPSLYQNPTSESEGIKQHQVC
ncbi:hypothetical protein HanRHA438_Chr16g0778801 [Helianthus annuus]|nr:hypothetical protein HanRHA438_Chr16g0778801 [Helianthus annuus]